LLIVAWAGLNFVVARPEAADLSLAVTINPATRRAYRFIKSSGTLFGAPIFLCLSIARALCSLTLPFGLPLDIDQF
jgi:hypothetical protein